MKKYTITFALLAVLSLANTSCQKEDTTTFTDNVHSQTDSRYSLYYTIDGKAGYATFATEEERRAFILQLMAMAQEGRSIRVSTSPLRACMSKEKVTFVTPNKEEAVEWMANMLLEGYEVSFSYDEGTGEYTCIAIK